MLCSANDLVLKLNPEVVEVIASVGLEVYHAGGAGEAAGGVAP